jgi:SAM-dependent methyltransferase
VTLLNRLQEATERMDEPDADEALLEAALRHVAAVNRWTGARRALLRHLPEALPPDRDRVLDVGTGAGDLPLAIADWAARRGRTLRLTAIDRHPGTLAVARRHLAPRPGIHLARADAVSLPFPTGSFDLALLSMTLHHLDGSALVGSLAELRRVAAGGRVIVAELERALPNYLGARLLAATVWRRNSITRHDGPVSVLRAFSPAELHALAARAGLREPRVHRHPFYRLVLTARA